MTVAEVMTSFPEALEPGASIQTAARAMRDGDYGAVPIVDAGGTLVGILTDRDIVVQAVAEGRDLDTPVRQLMTAYPDTVAADTPIEQAITVMQSRQIRRLPVMENGRLVGMVSLGDIAVSAAPPAPRRKPSKASRSGPAAISRSPPRRASAMPSAALDKRRGHGVNSHTARPGGEMVYAQR